MAPSTAAVDGGRQQGGVTAGGDDGRQQGGATAGDGVSDSSRRWRQETGGSDGKRWRQATGGSDGRQRRQATEGERQRWVTGTKHAGIPKQYSLSSGKAGNWGGGRAGREAPSAMNSGWTGKIRKQQVQVNENGERLQLLDGWESTASKI